MDLRLIAAAAAFGVWLQQQQPELPDPSAIAAAFAAGLLGGALALSRPGRRFAWLGLLAGIFAAFSIAGAWSAARAQLRLSDALPAQSEGRDIRVTGVVAGLPHEFDRGVRFEFAVEAADAQVPSRLWLAWYGGWQDGELHDLARVRSGERWRFTVRLKRPHGNLNPHGFDYEAWLFERGLRATGYVRNLPAAERLHAFAGEPGHWIDRLREGIRDRFAAALGDRAYAGVLVALVIGDQRAIERDLWSVFNRTGTTHLMSISGLHVTMVGGLVFALMSLVWRRFPSLCLRLPAPKAAALGGWAGAAAYALLAGFAVPAQRTLYMLSVAAIALWMDRAVSASRVLSLALLVVLAADPWAVLSAGFWLSFGAVAILFYAASGRLGDGHWLGAWGRAQWAITLGMVPLLLALFQQFSLASPLANAAAIPVVSLIVAPLALVAAAVPFDPLLWLAHGVLSLLMALLEWLAGFPASVWSQAAPAGWAVMLALAGCAVALLPRGVPGRWIGAVMMLPVVLPQADRPAEGTARIRVLDVGQGTAVHVQTHRRDLLYDTGPQFSREANSGSRILLPYLRSIGVSRVDGLIVSHDDSDHSGGAASVIEGVPVGWMMSSLAQGHTLRASVARHHDCAAGLRWKWDEVEFEVLHPPAGAQPPPNASRNDASCVLGISAGGRRLLLTGDAQSAAEAVMLAAGAPALSADVLVVAHHGSRTSTSPTFLEAVAPALAVIPVGYRNRFGHPHPQTIAALTARGTPILRTDAHGAVTVSLSASGITHETERSARLRYWHGR